MATDKKDVFLCHASEDKTEIVIPVIAALKNAGITYWYDQAEIKWGDSIAQKVNDGLKVSRYVVVILSEAFLSKNWPQRELNSALNIEASSGQVRVLPLLVGSQSVKKMLIKQYPILNDKTYIEWDENAAWLIEALKDRLSSDDRSEYAEQGLRGNKSFEIPLPSIRKRFTQRDKDLFLKTSFGVIKAYFREGLGHLERENPEVETDCTDIHRLKFISTIYVRGEVRRKCKIWIGGPISGDSIAFNSGQFDIDSDNSYNGWLTVSDDGKMVGFETSNIHGNIVDASRQKVVGAEEGAKCLWEWFTADLSGE